MGTTFTPATIIGDLETREYNFLVDTGANFLALPLGEIEGLGLRPTGGTVRLISATGMVEVDTYFATGDLMGMRFGALMVPASTPLIGCELLQILRFKVNPVTEQLEKIPDDEPWTGGYL